ncbi:hypothetical protein FJZ26_04815, partial [Candidatus Parvarchaeota archaeon]|nr:hypothetical protein [Candidatus Parvarchaeota archaeon]
MRCNGYMPLGKSTILIFLLFAGTASSQVLNESSPITSLLAVAQELSMQNQYLPATQFYQNIPNDPSLSKLPGIMPSASGMIGPGQIVEKEGYIVELNQEAMVAYEQGLVRQAIKKKPTNQKTKPSAYELAQIKSKAVSYSRELEQAQLKTEASISKLLKKSVKANPKSKFKASFNGMVLDITAQEAEALSKSGLVRKVYPNKKVKALLRDSVPLTGASALWGLNPQGQSCAGDRSKCLTGKGIKIAVIDTGVDYTHPDLGKCNKAQVISGTCSKVSGWDFANDDNDPMDDRGHGTHVAASAAGKGDINSNGLQDTGEFWGVAPDAHIVAYKVLGSDGIGSRAGVISAIEKATDPNGDGDTSDHVDVISMSLGGPGDPDDPISIAVDNAVESGVVAIIAAGNSGPGGGDSDCRTESSGNAGSICSPGTARKAITIGAGNKNGLIAGFSSRGPVQFGPSSIAKPDLLAPGVNICAAQWKNWLNFLKCFDSAHISISGTSMATPHVAGAVALLKQARPDLSPESIKTILMFGAKDLGYDMYTQGAGLIDLQKAFALSQAAPLPELTVESGSAITSKTGGMFEVEFKAKILNIGLASASNVTYSIYLPNKTVIASGEIGSMLAGEQTNLTVSAPIQELYQYAILEVDPENQIVEYLEKNNKIEILLPFVRFAGWPVEYNSTVSSIQAAKLEGNGNLELLLSGTSNIYPVDSQGSILPGWPKKQPLLSSLLAAKPGSNTLMPDMPIFASKNPSQGSKYLVGIRKKDGSYAPGWPAIYNYPNTLSVADVDYDGENEIIARSLKVINILKYNGTQMPGWPKNISFGTDDYGSPLSYLPPAVAADLDENFYGMEIVYSTSQGTVNAIHLDGTNVPGWPQKISYLMMFGPFRRNITSSAEGHPVAADIDGDGKLEVLVRTGVVVPDEYPYLNFSNYVFAWHHNGTQVKGWPKDLYEDGVFGGSPLSIGDIDSGHPGLEVVEGTGGYGSGKLYVFHHDGTVAPGWPQNISVIKTPALADLDGDGNLEIVA